MLPDSGDFLKQDFEVVRQPSRTFRLDVGRKRVDGEVDGLEAVKQAAYCILSTERFEWLIYSWNYGMELDALFGMPMGLVKSRIKKRIREALMRDDRIQGVDAFVFEVSGRRLHVGFTVHTVLGVIDMEKEVGV